jgi:phage shock protein A
MLQGSQSALEGKVRALEAQVQRQRTSRHQIEAHMKDLYADYTTLQQMHGALEV